MRRVTSRDLLGDANELEIEHGGMLYRLRLTALGKLILTKGRGAARGVGRAVPPW